MSTDAITQDAIETLELFGAQLVYGRHEKDEALFTDTGGTWLVKVEDLNEAALSGPERTDALATGSAFLHAHLEWWNITSPQQVTK